SHFSGGIGYGQYTAVSSMDKLQKIIEEALVSYNETNPAMNLVLFQDALIHVARINRILESPRGIQLLENLPINRYYFYVTRKIFDR
ncbi:unnamed protein product, partial [Adineta steineri]